MVNSWKDLTAAHYMELMDLKDQNRIIEIVYGKPLKDIPLNELNAERLAFLKQDPEKDDIRFFTHEGKRYGMAKLDELSFGEYIDITSFAEDWKANVWKIMCIVYRPIIGLSLKQKIKTAIGKYIYGVGVFASNKKWIDKGTAMMMNMDYKIAKYDDKDLEREEIYKTMGANQFHSFVLFFSLLYLKRIEDTLRSMDKPKRRKKSPSPKKQ